MWNWFIHEVYDSFLKDKSKSFSAVQKNAIIAFAYDAHVNSGGHTHFFDCFGDVFAIDEVAQALRMVGNEEYALNFLSAAAHIHYTGECGYMDDDEDAESDPVEDDIYYGYYGTDSYLPDLLETYIFDNRESIFV